MSAELQRISGERQGNWAVFASLTGVAILTAGAYFALSTSDQPLPPSVAPWIWTGIAILPTTIAAYGISILNQIGISSYYTREVERQLTDLLGRGRKIPPSLYETVNTTIIGHRRGLWQYRIIYGLEYIILGVMIVVCSGLAAAQIDLLPLKVVVIAILFLITVVTANLSYTVIFHGAETWEGVRSRVLYELGQPFPYRQAARKERRLISYLALPRPNDLAVKGVLLHLCSALVGAWLVRDMIDWSTTVALAGLSFMSFEVLMYQARYMWNDKRGVSDDVSHPEVRARKRLPTLDSTTRRNAVVAVIAMRVISAAALVALLPRGRLQVGLGLALVATWVLAHRYERLRGHPHKKGDLSFGPWTRSIYLIVGGSYAVRAGFGIYLGSDGQLGAAIVLLLAAAFYFSGISTVLMVWVLESTLYVGMDRADGPRRRTARSVASTDVHASTENVVAAKISAQIGSKMHLVPLAESAQILSPTATESVRPLSDDELPFHDRRVLANLSSLSHPWNRAFLVSCPLASLGGWMASEVLQTPWLGWGLLVLGLGTIAGLAALRIPTLTAGSSACALIAHGWIIAAEGGHYDGLFISFPLVVILCTYAVTRQMNYLDAITFLSKAVNAPMTAIRRLKAIAREIVR